MEARYTDGRYLDDNPDWHDADAPWKAARIAEFTRSLGVQPESVLDIGCGTGGVLRCLRQVWPAANLVGYDVSPIPIEMATQAGADGIEFRVGGPEQVERQFDLVLALDVFEHVADYLGFLGSLRVLGTSHLFHIPLELSAQTVLRELPLLISRETLGHLHHFTQGTALATIRDAGYEVLAQRLVDISGCRTKWKTRVARLPRRMGFRLNPVLSARLLGGCTLLVYSKPVET